MSVHQPIGYDDDGRAFDCEACGYAWPCDGAVKPVLAAHNWRTNGELIADVARLGYLRSEWWTLDPTYGEGGWWKNWKPLSLTCHDITIDGTDFRDLSWLYEDSLFDAIAYDPPYVAKGGRETSGIKEMDARYGQDVCPATPALLQELINDGLTEMYRLVKPRGIVLVKCQDYISSGKLWIGTHWTVIHALTLGFECIDRFEMYGSPRPQPPGRRQVHARRNLSTLFVLRAPRVKVPPPEPMPDIDICDHCLAPKRIGLNLCLVHGSQPLPFSANKSGA